MKDEMGGVTIEEVVGLKSKIYLFLADDSSDYRKAKGVNKKFVARISPGGYKDVLLKNKCLRHSVIKFKVKIIKYEPMK